MTDQAQDNGVQDVPDSGAQRAARRALLAGGAAAGVSALGLIAAPRASAAAARTLSVGVNNYVGTANTGLVTSGATGLDITNKGAGRAMSATGEGTATGALLRCVHRDRWGVQAMNLATTTGTAGALLARGGKNIGALVDTTAAAVPALVVRGGGADGIAVLATGSAYLDGDVLALRSWVGVPTVDDKLSYVGVSSSARATHSVSGKVTLSGSGTATVTLDADYLAAIEREEPGATISERDQLRVQLTALGAAMPNLHVATRTEDGFTIAGGTASGTVFWEASAPRLWLQFAPGATAAGKVAGAAVTKSAPALMQRRSLAAGLD